VLHAPTGHPRRTVLAMRAITAAGADGSEALARASAALFAAYWARGEDVASPEVVARALARAGLDGAGLVARAALPEVKASLFATTREAARRGVFGAPTFFVTRSGRDEEMFWGQDRLDWVEAAAAPSPADTPDGEARR
jgi:2-hydroxychromene-2-carboxylate isomerase